MNMFVALLRAVNVAGHGKLPMAELRDAITAAGYRNVRTLLQSGNVALETDRGSSSKELESELEALLQKHFDLNTEVTVRAASAWRQLVTANPLAQAAERDPSHLVVLVAKTSIRPGAVVSLQRVVKEIGGSEQVAAASGALYVFFPDGIGRSRLSHALTERTLGASATGRNWNTVLKIAAALGNPPARVSDQTGRRKRSTTA